MPWFRYCYLQVIALLVPLKPVNILSHRYLNRLNDWRELAKLGLQEGSVRIAIVFRKTNGRGDIKVMLKSGDVKEY
jgi:hypothetical protein